MDSKIIKTKYGRTFYIGKDSTSDLQHWKYIKKERVNGKWRYYYDTKQLKDDLGVDELDRYKLTKAKFENAAAKRRDAERAVDMFLEYTNNLPNTREGSKEYHEAFKNNRELFWESEFWKETEYERGKEFSSAKAELYKTPVGKIVKASNAVKDFVESIFLKFT